MHTPHRQLQASWLPLSRSELNLTSGIFRELCGRPGTFCSSLMTASYCRRIRCSWLFACQFLLGCWGDGGLLASASTLNVVTVPFSGCSLLEARKFLSVVYSHESAERHINDDTNLSIARVSHMYEWKVRHLTMDCTSLLAVRSPCFNKRSFTSRACTAGFGGAHR